MGPRCGELRSPDADALERAAAVLRGTPVHRRDQQPHPPLLSWEILPMRPDEPDESAAAPRGPSWLVRRLDTREEWTRASLESALRIVEFGSVMAVVDGEQSGVTLHGALLDRSGTGLLILGPCESGKSTLAAALWRAGWTLLGDDVSMADLEGRVRPVPRRVSLRHGSRALLGDALWSRILASPSCSETEDGYLFHPSELDPVPHPPFTALGAIVFLARRGVQLGAAELSPINGGQALLALAPYSNVIRRQGLPEALERLGPLANAAPAFDLGRGPLADMIAAIERAVRPPS